MSILQCTTGIYWVVLYYECAGHKIHYIPRVPQCLSPRRNWDSPNLSPASECAPPTWVLGGELHSLAGERVEKSQFGRLEEMPSTLSTLWRRVKEMRMLEFTPPPPPPPHTHTVAASPSTISVNTAHWPLERRVEPPLPPPAFGLGLFFSVFSNIVLVQYVCKLYESACNISTSTLYVYFRIIADTLKL